jgi:hypothetical protein
MRQSENAPEHYGIGRPREDLIFSLVDGFVWASWPGTIASVKLGTQAPVTAVMRDFLTQCELGDRLTSDRNVDE